MQTPYARRIALAAGFSFVAHAVFLAVLAVMPSTDPVEASVTQLVRLRLEPPPPEPARDAPRRLIDAVAEGAPPEQPTDLIAEVDARAQDMSDTQGDEHSPSVDELAEYERIAALPPSPAPQPERPSPALEPLDPIESAPQPETPPQPETESQPETPQPAREADTTPPSTPAPTPEPESERPSPEPRIAEPQPAEPNRPEPERPEPERIEVAQAQPDPPEPRTRQDNPTLREPRPPAPPSDAPSTSAAPSPSAARVQGAVMNKGFLGFEAMRDDVAPYLAHVRDKVERQWRLMMELEYRGAARARAVIDCAIKPNGELAFVRIHDHGGNQAYAAACASAIRRAAPFNAFPFDVPALYRDEEIMIRWTFQFM